VGRPKSHDERTRRELLRAAEELVASHGPQALSVRMVADAAHTTTRAVYSVFGGKSGLFSALYREAFRVLIRRVEALPMTEAPDEDLVRMAIGGFRRYALEHPHLFRVVFEQRIDDGKPTEEDVEVGLEARRLLQSRVQRCAEAGLVPEAAVIRLTAAFHALCQGLASMELQGRLRQPDDPALLWKESFIALIRGFRK
jgi:AcrR family transcriptional regulator